jgi:hypothetical protein
VAANRVQLNDAAGPVGALRETPDKTLTVTGLTAGKAYTFTVNAQNGAGYGAESAKSAPFTPTQVTDQLTIATAKWKAGDFRVTGTASVVGKTVSVRTGLATGPVLGSAVVHVATRRLACGRVPRWRRRVGRLAKGAGVVVRPRGLLAGGLGIGAADGAPGCFALGRMIACAAQVAEDSGDPEHAPYVARAGRDREAPTAPPGAFAAVDELADTGRVEVVKLVEHHDDPCARALLCQQRLAEIALRGDVECAVQDQPGRAVNLATSLDGERPFAVVTT